MKNQLRKVASFVKQIYIRSIQARNMQRQIKYRDSLILFLIPGHDLISGGILSIYGFYYATKAIFADSATVLMCTYPNRTTTLRYGWFKNEVDLVLLNTVLSEFKNASRICIHLPEYYVKEFVRELTPAQQDRLRKIKHLQLNVLNQNIEYMPPVSDIEALKKLTADVTSTTAHFSYTTQAVRNLYNVPTHLLSAWFEQKEIVATPYATKRDVMIVSPDEHPAKEQILQKLAAELPGIEQIVIRNMPYDDYKKLEQEAKWAVSFGEGFDGYTVFPVLKGGVSFAAYNPEFFLPKYQEVPTFYESYDVMAERIVVDIKRLDNQSEYDKYSAFVAAMCREEYSYELYKSRVAGFYNREFTLP